MTRKEMIKEIAARTELTQAQATTMLNCFQDVVRERVSNDDKVALTGFMTFEKKHVEETSGETTLGGVKTPWTKPAHDVIKVSLSKSYKTL